MFRKQINHMLVTAIGMLSTPFASQASPVSNSISPVSGVNLTKRCSAALAAIMLVLAAADAHALIDVGVHAIFPAGGFTSGPIYGTSGPEVFDVTFRVDESQAVRYAAGFEIVPGQVVIPHDVYAIGYPAILGASSFNFGNQAFSGNSMANLAYAFLPGSLVSAPMFLTDITPGSTPFILAVLGPGFLGLGSYDFVPGTPLPVFLTNGAQVYDGIRNAFGSVSVSITAVPEPDPATLLSLGLAALAWRVARRSGQRNAPARAAEGR